MSDEELKQLAAKLPLKKGSKHELLRKVIVDGFLDSEKSSNEVIEEIRQTTGKRLKSSVIQTYMRKFMEAGIVRVLPDEGRRANLWILACERNGQRSQRPNGRNGSVTPGQRISATPEAFSLPAHPVLETPKSKILFLGANPVGGDQLALERECREIEERIRGSKHRDGFEFVSKWAVRTRDLLQLLIHHRAHVIHFSGHGNEAEELILLDEKEEPKTVSKKVLKHIFSTLKDNIRVVVLNACYSQAQAEAITEVIDCAIGMRRDIGDEGAIIFAAHFYEAIGYGRSVKDAFDCGKAALMLEKIPDEKIPQLLVRKGVDAKEIFLA